MGPLFLEILIMKPNKNIPAFVWWCNLLYGTIQYKDIPAFDWWCNLLYGTTAEPHFKNPLNNQAQQVFKEWWSEVHLHEKIKRFQ